MLLGTGDRRRRALLRVGRRAQRGDQFRAWLGFDNGRAHRIEAGADFFLMPSRFEPCGLNQMYSLRYGTLPIVRATGGLVDTVDNYDEATGGGTGFVFHDLTSRRAGEHHRLGGVDLVRPPATTSRRMRQRAMAQDFSWDRAAADYEQLYRDAYARRRGHAFGG